MEKMEAAFLVPAGGTRSGATLNVFGNQVNVLVAGDDVNRTFCVMEAWTEPNSGPPLHRHDREDEWWYILEGRFRFEVNGQIIEAGPGDSVFAARGTVHTFQNIGDTMGRHIVTCQPAGLDEFFREISAATEPMEQPDLKVIIPIFDRYGLALLGPPLAAR